VTAPHSHGAPATAIRIAMLVLCGGLSLLADAGTLSSFAIALLAGYAIAMERVAVLRRHPVLAGLCEATAAGATVALSAGADSPMLPYLLASMLALGLAGTVGHVVSAAGATVLGLVAGRVVADVTRDAVDPLPGTLQEYAVVTGQWVALGLCIGVVAGWARHLDLAGSVPDGEDRYVEARALLEQLRGVTHHLPGGLDVATVATDLLEQCAEVAPSARSAVLVQPATGGLVPAAVRGTARVPWRAPLSAPGPLRRAWQARIPIVDRREPDQDGRRVGSSLAVLPLMTGAEPFGLLILESYEADAFPAPVVDRLAGVARQSALRLETGLLFEEVRTTVSLQERDRLAREMHDGVAQELAYVGYELDALRGEAAKVDPALAERLVTVRAGLTSLISDIRLSITDLRTSVSSDRGLGAALGSYVRALGSGGRLATHLSLDESAFRLPGEIEVLLFKIAQEVAQNVRKQGQADNLWVTLATDPPSARLCIEYDGGTSESPELDLSAFAEQVAALGGSLVVTQRLGLGGEVEVTL
jgi:signal transduction histidine kinase